MGDRPPIKVGVESRDGAVIVRPEGEIGYQEAPEFRAHLRQGAGPGVRKMIVDLSGVTYMSTPGVATLVEALQASKRGGPSLVLCGMSDRVRGIFEIARLHSVFRIVGSLDEALGD